MRLFICLFILTSLLFAACQSGARIFTNLKFSENGYEIQSPYGVFIYEKSSNKSTMTINTGIDEKKFIDYGSDNTVDEVHYKFKIYKRDAKGTEEIFTSADKDWIHYKEKLKVQTVNEEWQNMTPDDFARNEGFFKRYSD